MWRNFGRAQLPEPPDPNKGPSQIKSEEKQTARSESDRDEEMPEQEDTPAPLKEPKQKEDDKDPIKIESDHDDDQEEPQDSIHATDEQDDEEPDYGGEEESDTNPADISEGDEPEELDPDQLPKQHPFASYADSFLTAISWFYQKCHFVTTVRPHFQYLPQNQRDYNNVNHGIHIHGLQFFKVWDHVGDRHDDLKRYGLFVKNLNDTMIHLRDHPLTWHMQIVPTVFNYQGNVDLPETHRNVRALAKILNTEDQSLWVTAQLLLFLQEKISRVITAVLRHTSDSEHERHRPLPRETDGSIRLDNILKGIPKLRSYCGNNALLLIAAPFHVSKNRCCMAITYRGDPLGPPPRDSGKWIRNRDLPKGSILNKDVKDVYLAPLSCRSDALYRSRFPSRSTRDLAEKSTKAEFSGRNHNKGAPSS